MSLMYVGGNQRRGARNAAASWPITSILRAAIVAGSIGLFVAGCAAVSSHSDDDEVTAAVLADTATLAPRAVAIGGFETATVQMATWRDSWRVPGRLTLDPAATHALGSIVDGRITQVLVHPGDRVRAGQVLVTMHSHEMFDVNAALSAARTGLARAESAFRLASAAADRADRLFAARALSRAELEQAHAARAEAEALREQAIAEFERATEMHEHLVGEGPVPAGVTTHEVLIRAPIDGIVVAREAEPGTVALIGTPLITVSRLNTLALNLNLPEEAVAAAQVGTPVRFTTNAYPGQTFEATLQRVGAAVDARTRTLEVVARVENAEGLLRPEMYVNAEVLGKADDETIVVPAESVHLLADQTVVIAAEPHEDGGLFIEALPVRVGRRTGSVVEILAGLEPDQVIVVQGAATARAELLRRREAEE